MANIAIAPCSFGAGSSILLPECFPLIVQRGAAHQFHQCRKPSSQAPCEPGGRRKLNDARVGVHCDEYPLTAFLNRVRRPCQSSEEAPAWVSDLTSKSDGLPLYRIGVSMAAGQNAPTRMPRAAASMRRLVLKPTTACLVRAECVNRAAGPTSVRDDVLTICPRPGLGVIG